MKVSRTASVISFLLTLQFLATLWWIVEAWPMAGPGGLSNLAEGMAAYFIANLDNRAYFTAINLYNVSFGLTAVSLVVLLRDYFAAARTRYFLAILWLAGAAVMYVASGIIPIAAADALVASGDGILTQTVVVVATGLVLGATFSSGVGVFFAGWSLLTTRFAPTLLCCLMFISAGIEVTEYLHPLLLILDPLVGTIWSIWLGLILWHKPEPTSAVSL